MKIARVGLAGQETPVLVGDGGVLYDLSHVTPDITAEFLADGGIERINQARDDGTLVELDVVGDVPARFGPPLKRPPKLICVGLNYALHAAESGVEPPSEPVLFAKMTNTVIGPDDEVLIPRGSTKTDYEVELAIVIGREARYLPSEEAARDCILGYAISNDVSEREFQLERGGQWVKGKSCETFNPLGPWLVTADEVGDPQALGLRLWVNGELRQSSTTADMIFGVHHLVRYISQFMVLEPGDVINTGTPAGVALGKEEIPYLKAGDVMELEIDGLGRQRQVLGQA